MTAKIQLVGAGPGDVELLTVKAYRAIQQAQVLLVDRLVPEGVVALASPDCQVRIAGKKCGKADLAQAELDQWGLEALSEGKRVVRVKNGDPFVFGRGGEEAVVYASQGYEVEIIPGITSALMAPLTAGIPVTMRDVADQFLVCTGHGKANSFPNLPDFCSHRTTVFLMALGRIRSLSKALQLEKGYPSDLPAALVFSATCPNALTVKATLATIADEVEPLNLKSPATLVVGKAVTALDFLETLQRPSPNVAKTPVDKPSYQLSYRALPLQIDTRGSSFSLSALASPKQKTVVYVSSLAFLALFILFSVVFIAVTFVRSSPLQLLPFC